MNYSRITSCAAVAFAFAVQPLFAEPVDEKMTPAPSAITDEATKAVTTMFPNAKIAGAKLNMDRGIEVYYVQLMDEKEVNAVEVSQASAMIKVPVMVMQTSKYLYKLDDLPPEVMRAANTQAIGEETGSQTVMVTHGVSFQSAEKLQIFADFKTKSGKSYDSEGANYQLVPLDKPVTAYDVTYVNKNGEKGVVRVDLDGKVINPINWMKHAAATVPQGKLVIRANLGCVADYTDLSGVVWSTDRMYPKQGKGQPAPAAQPGEIVWGGLGGEPRGGRQHTRVGLVIQGTDAPFIYDSERDKEGQFQFDVPNGLYTVRIHFCETWPDAVKPPYRLFAIKIQGNQVADKLNIADKAGGLMKPYVLEYKDIQVTDGHLKVEPFGQGNDRHATIEAYEVIQQ